MRFTLRFAALLVLLTLSFNELAHAAHLPRTLQPMLRQASAAPMTAPIPTQIAAAHNVFLVNEGADPNFPYTSEESYNAVYNALKAWGKYQLVSTPEQADLIFQLKDVAPITGVGGGGRTGAYAITSPAFQLSILDAHTNAILWTVDSPVELGRLTHHAKWFNISVTNLISRVKVVAGEPLSVVESADLTEHSPSRNLGLYLIIGGAALAVGMGFLFKHEFDKSVEKQNQQVCQEAPALCPAP